MSEPRQIEGFVCEGVSDGEQICTGCWDAKGQDICADNDVPQGEPIYWRRCSIEYDEWDPYCERCAAAFYADAELPSAPEPVSAQNDYAVK